MSSKGTTLSMIQARFPGREGPVARAYGENRSFHELCDDYQKCASAVDRWQRSEGNGVASHRQEYEELLEELGLEIRTWLEAMEPVAAPEKAETIDD